MEIALRAAAGSVYSAAATGVFKATKLNLLRPQRPREGTEQQPMFLRALRGNLAPTGAAAELGNEVVKRDYPEIAQPGQVTRQGAHLRSALRRRACDRRSRQYAEAGGGVVPQRREGNVQTVKISLCLSGQQAPQVGRDVLLTRQRRQLR